MSFWVKVKAIKPYPTQELMLKDTTKKQIDESVSPVSDNSHLTDQEWQELVETLEEKLQLTQLAYQTGAFTRRRKIQTAGDVLRLILGYSECDWSLWVLGGWHEDNSAAARRWRLAAGPRGAKRRVDCTRVSGRPTTGLTYFSQ